jgi:hypothetical protein
MLAAPILRWREANSINPEGATASRGEGTWNRTFTSDLIDLSMLQI